MAVVRAGRYTTADRVGRSASHALLYFRAVRQESPHRADSGPFSRQCTLLKIGVGNWARRNLLHQSH